MRLKKNVADICGKDLCLRPFVRHMWFKQADILMPGVSKLSAESMG